MAESRVLPVLPLRDIVVFPKMAAPLFVGREKSVRALDEVMRKDKQILLAAQIDAAEDEPARERIFKVGTVATVVQLLKLPDGTVRVLVEGMHRARIANFVGTEEFFEAEVEELEETNADSPEARAIARAASDQWENYTKLSRKTGAENQPSIAQITEPSRLADTIANQLTAKIADKQALLDDVPVAIVYVRDGVIADCNRRCEESSAMLRTT